MKIQGSGKAKTMRVAWIGSRSGDLRLEMLGLWGQPLATFLVKKSIFYLYMVKDNICYQGKNTAAALSKILGVSIGKEDLVDFLSGQPPIPTFHKARIKGPKSDGRRILSLYGRWNRIIQKMWLMADQKSVERVELFDSFGDVKYTILFSEFGQQGDYEMPYRIHVSWAGGTNMLLNIQSFDSGVSAPERAFELDLSNAKLVVLDS